jgi:energy-coupling factor transporter ATP-binding protein EcfA2
MLVRLFGRNFRSLKKPFELSMVAAELPASENSGGGLMEATIKGFEKPLRLLRCAAIYGPNASGKSTVLTASRALRWLATDSSPRSKPDAPIPTFEPFLLDEASRRDPVLLGCDVVHGTSILRYEIEYDARAILREELKLLGEKEITLIDRNPTGEVGGDLIERSKANRLYVKEMQPNVAVLSKLAQHGPARGGESAQPYYRAIRDATRFADASAPFGMGIDADQDKFADDPSYREWVMRHLIRPSDLGICDVKISREDFEVPDVLRELAKINSDITFPTKRVVVSFVHEGSTRQPIDFSDESSGTRKLFGIAAKWHMLATSPVTLFVDELSASLHPRLLDRLVRVVNEASAGHAKSQMIFATHDTGLLESQDGRLPALRRDQVYFTKKNYKGEAELYSLTEFKDEDQHGASIRKRYLSGLYGAIPSVEKISL